jgi:23S rRNA pseudouridine2605 synthase
MNRRPRKHKPTRTSESPRNASKESQQRLDDPNKPFRLNKFIAHAGYCSRREADTLIASGQVKVNGTVVTEMGVKVTLKDQVVVKDQPLNLEPHVYILLNKGTDTISTTNDEKGRKTVMDAIEDATGYRVYPVGRLDRNTTGLLVLTNDGELAHRLMHPSYKVKKTYVATSRDPLSEEALAQMKLGVPLEDGTAKAVSVKRSSTDPTKLTLMVEEGRNHLIRRMIAYFGTEVIRLKRTIYAGLTDRDIRVGRWRYLKPREIDELKRLVGLSLKGE